MLQLLLSVVVADGRLSVVSKVVLQEKLREESTY